MTTPHSEDSPPTPVVKKRSGISLVWLIPLITALIGGWLIFKTISETGPKIEITFKTAEGIEAGKTKIKYKEIAIGVVDSVGFSEDFSNVILKTSMEKNAEAFLGRGARFWVVKPRLSLRGASGLTTLFSGSYIELEPGQGPMEKTFQGLDKPPVIKADVAGKKALLVTNNLGSIDTGSPVYFQGILAGEILGWELDKDQKSIFIHAFIKAPYDRLIKSNTRFWNISGIDLSMGAEGISMRTESLASLLYGGIAFETPDTLEPVKKDTEGLAYTLFDNYKAIHDASFLNKLTCVLFFEGSVRGLKQGAPVEFKGIKVGLVKEIRLEFDKKDASFRIPVLVEIESDRFAAGDGTKGSTPFEIFNTLIAQGLRARLQNANLLTGQLFVELDMHPDSPVKLVNNGGPFPELPTIPADLEQMTTSVKNILARMEKLDMEKIGFELAKTLEGANKLINGRDVAETVDELKGSLALLKKVLNKLDQHIDPIAMNLENTIGAGHEALKSAQVTLGLMDEVLNTNSPLQYKFIELTSELSEMARSIRILVDMLERNPNAVIFGKQGSGEK